MQSPRCASGEATTIAVVVDSAMEILIQIPDIILYRFNALHMHENKLTMCQEKALVLVGAFSLIVKLQYSPVSSRLPISCLLTTAFRRMFSA